MRPKATITLVRAIARRKTSTAVQGSTKHQGGNASLPFTELAAALKGRRIPLTYDTMTRERSHRLDVSLASFLPFIKPERFPFKGDRSLPPLHHFLYLEPSVPAERLLADGTNPEHFPGSPFSRRLWAGGSIRYQTTRPCRLDDRPAVCLETIRSVDTRGKPGQEKMFVGIERRIGRLRASELGVLGSSIPGASVSETEDRIRQRLWRTDESDFGDSSILERRTVVFLRDPRPQASEPLTTRVLRARHAADLFSHVFTPDRSLLFRYSALTFNAHAIHFDPEYCRELESHPGTLVHGTLSLTCLVLMLRSVISPLEAVESLEYRNLAPLYCNHPVRLCGHRLRNGVYELWAETPEGGIATQATVKTAHVLAAGT